ncbi:ZP domain-containing protein-like [Branchiostoma floridae x Branchiostoma belcheri]
MSNVTPYLSSCVLLFCQPVFSDHYTAHIMYECTPNTVPETTQTGRNVTTIAPVNPTIPTQGPPTAPKKAPNPCPQNYEHVVVNGAIKCMRFSAKGDRKSYQAASQTCRDEGARLVVIKSAELDTFIDNRIKTTYAAETWIGLDDLTAPASQYRWSDGSVLGSGDFNDWSPGQPDTIYREKCVEIRPQFSYQWNNHHCNLPKNYICEIQLLPTPPADISASTTCTNEYMELSIPEDQLTDINSNNLHWKPDRNCGATTNGTHYIFRTQLYGCGTQVKFGPRYVEFLNTINILGIHFNTGVITRDSDISITSKCNYERQEWVESTFLPIPGGLNFTEEGFGQLEVRLSIFSTRQYQRQYRADQYPIHLRLRQHVYMQLEVQGHGQKLSVLALNCKATMSPSPNDNLQYQLIRDGCSSDPTLKTYDVDDPGKERFGFEAFRFIREVRTVYVHCEVLVCDAADSGSRCAQGCVKRGKRAVGISDMRGRHMIYQGPIILDGDKEDALYLEESRQTTGPGPRSGLWTTMAAGGVLMALALLVIGAATILKRSRRDKWAYQGLPNMKEDGE